MSERDLLLRTDEEYTIDGNELRQLRGDYNDDRIPLWLDDRAWVRIPARIGHGTWSILTTPSKIATWMSQRLSRAGGSLLHCLLILVPFAIFSSARDWNSETVFALNLLALLPLENVVSSTAELIAFKLGDTAEEAVNLVLPHVFPLIISLTSIAKGNIVLAQFFIVGSLLSNILLGLGGSFLAAGLLNKESGFNETATTTEASVLYTACVPIGMAGAMNLALRHFWFDTRELEMYFSHVASIELIILYAFYQLFKTRTHRMLWDEEVMDSESEHESGVEYAQTGYASGLVVLVLTLCGALIFTCDCAASVAETSSRFESQRFLNAILLPLVTNASHYYKTYHATYMHGVNVAVSLTLATNAHIMLFDLPVLVLVGWALKLPVSLNIGLTSTIILIVCVITSTHMIVAGKSTYLTGAMYQALYVIICLGYYLWDGSP